MVMINDTMACNVCRKFTRLSDPKSALVLGTNKFRKDPLYKHEKSTCHIACVNHQCYLDSKGKPGSATSTAIGRGILALHEKHRKRLMILFNTVYGLTKKNRPFTDFPTVCSIQEKNGLGIMRPKTHIHHTHPQHLSTRTQTSTNHKSTHCNRMG